MRAARGDHEARTIEEACAPRDDEQDPRLISHEQGIAFRTRLIAGTVRGLLRHTRTSELEDAAIFDGGGYYVQMLVRPELLQVYAEAVDLDAQGMGSLTESQRELLDRLGIRTE